MFGALDALFIKGKFEPPVSGVEVRLESSDATVEEKITTANDGQYVFGPLNPHLKYTVNPTHQTYRFLPIADDGESGFISVTNACSCNSLQLPGVTACEFGHQS